MTKFSYELIGELVDVLHTTHSKDGVKNYCSGIDNLECTRNPLVDQLGLCMKGRYNTL